MFDTRHLPEWKTGCPRTYQQMISGGGKCGPRAWFGRFVCKSFGIPTWGVRQPGHAAMSRWVPIILPSSSNLYDASGSCCWRICLGGPNWKKSYWENQRGEDFEMDVKARECMELYDVVFWLECLAKGSRDSVQSSFWLTLSQMQKKEIAALGMIRCRVPEPKITITGGGEDVIRQVYKESGKGKELQIERTTDSHGQRIILPVDSSVRSGNHTNDVIYMRSYGPTKGIGTKQQVHLVGNGSITFELMLKTSTVYYLQARIVTVHDNQQPLRLQVTNSNHSAASYDIPIPYTKGYWDMTEGIQVRLNAGRNRLCFYRQNGLGLTIQEFLLVPANVMPC